MADDRNCSHCLSLIDLYWELSYIFAYQELLCIPSLLEKVVLSWMDFLDVTFVLDRRSDA